MPQRLEGRDFSSDTVPTREQVQSVIEDVAAEVVAYLDAVEVEPEHHALARYAVKMGAAAEIERGFYPEQHDLSDTATYARYIRRYRELLDQLRDSVLGTSSGAAVLISTRVLSASGHLTDCGDEQLP